MLLRDYVFWKQGIPPHICDQILKYGTQLKSESGKIGTATGTTKKDVRDSQISWVNAKWIWDWILDPVRRANESIFKYNINEVEDAQFTKYTAGQFYDWHVDIKEDEPDNIAKNYCRKLSIIIPLSDPSEYEGGNIEFRSLHCSPDGKYAPPLISKDEFKEKGTLLIFPSIIWHRVKPVTKGTRYSLVAWWGGPFFT
jgi:PKHD-type hydroxylase|tara:strand:+ start:817 stop:1407 length:591 start_codon:yes stop_codon:yes gene_type:complete